MPNPILLKVAPLLAEFLLANKRLDLPGIGSFLMGGGEQPDQASFESNPGVKESPELIAYIAGQTGKIRALAAADLDSHLENARQFLNIGKPFLFEGIGSLVKQRSGQYSFTPGEPVVEKANPRAVRESEQADTDPTTEGFKSIFYAPRVKTNHRKTVFIFLLVTGMGLAIWGGYMVYKKTTSKTIAPETAAQPVSEKEQTAAATPLPAVETTIQTVSDTLVNKPAPAPASIVTAAPGQFKYVVETADKLRGLTRYNRLKGFGLDVKMETRDSVSFKLYFLVPSLPADTTRILDSLKRLYTPAGGMAYVE